MSGAAPGAGGTPVPPSLTVAVGTYFGRHGRCRAPPETAPGLPPAVRPLPQTAAATARSGDSDRAHAPLRGWVDPPLLKWRRGLDDVVRRSQDGGSARTRFREGGTKWRGARSPPLLIRVSARPPVGGGGRLRSCSPTSPWLYPARGQG